MPFLQQVRGSISASAPPFPTHRAAAELGPKARVSLGLPPSFFETEEADEVGEEDEEPRWSGADAEFDGGGSDEEGEVQEWAGGNGSARGEDVGADAGEDLSSWTRQWPRPRPRELFVCNLPRRCGIEDLLEPFRPHGTVLSVEICCAPAATAWKNVKLTHITPMKDHIFESPHKIYVGNLAWSVQPQDLRERFTRCRNVVSTRLLTDCKGGRNRVYGFLSFSSAEELEAALKLDRTVFHGRDIIFKEAHVERQRQMS